MMRLENEMVGLRAIEPIDVDVLFDVENDLDLWKYSNRSQPYSKDLLQRYIDHAHRDIFETRQIKFTVIDQEATPIGFIDLFDYEPLHHRAGVGLVILKEKQSKGYGAAALELIGVYAKKYLQLHQLFAHIASENTKSIRLFEAQGYVFVGTKKEWNFYEGQFQDESTFQKIF
jgi:diamine N-acetyltransferase